MSPRTIDLIDLGLALVVVVVGLAEVITGQVPAPLWAGVVVSFLFGVPLAVRRSHPWTAFVAVFATLVLCWPLGVSLENNLASVISCVIMMATVAMLVPIWPSLGALAAAIGALLPAADGIGGLLWVVFIAAASWTAGRLIRQRRLLIDELRATTGELAVTRDRYAELAVETERARISRELHDVVAHSVSVMVVQAGAAERMIDIDPARAQSALGSIQATGRQALQELRLILGVLRSVDGDAETTPQPGLGDLDHLAEAIRRAGVSLDIDRTGDVRPLPAGVELAAYRIIQEALTNVVKHASASAASVRLDYGPDWLALTVTDDGAGGASLVPGAGQGLIGMTERAELYDGRLISGPAPDGGFSVTTRLRIEATT